MRYTSFYLFWLFCNLKTLFVILNHFVINKTDRIKQNLKILKWNYNQTIPFEFWICLFSLSFAIKNVKKKKKKQLKLKKITVTYASAPAVESVVVIIGGCLFVDPPKGGSGGRVNHITVLEGVLNDREQ